MARAINSLPVPVSPSTSTVALVGATRSTSASADSRAGLLPMICSNLRWAHASSIKSRLDTVHLHAGKLWEAPRITAERSLAPHGFCQEDLRHRKAYRENRR